MNNRFWTVFFGLLLLVIGFNAGYLLGQSPWAPFRAFSTAGTTPVDDQLTDTFWESWDLIHTRYYQQPVDDQALIDGAIDGMMTALGDQYSRYLPPAEEAQEQQEMEGEFTGIGVVVESIDGAITVISPIEGTPAEAAGLRPGDILREANGIDLTDMDLTEAADIIRGPEGTPVTLVIERDGERQTLEIIRARIEVPSVRGEMLDNGVGYIRINQFIRTTGGELQSTLDTLLAQNPTGIVLDLRHNPGGLLDQVTDVADEFLPKGVMMIEEQAGNSRTVETTDDGALQDIPLVVLIDEGSASASEVLAGAIQERGRGTLIGMTSFGKGTVQEMHGLRNGGGLRLTISRWLTPEGNWVHEKGLAPDITINLPEDVVRGEEGDTQLKAAMDYLQGQPVLSEPPAGEGN